MAAPELGNGEHRGLGLTNHLLQYKYFLRWPDWADIFAVQGKLAQEAIAFLPAVGPR